MKKQLFKVFYDDREEAINGYIQNGWRVVQFTSHLNSPTNLTWICVLFEKEST